MALSEYNIQSSSQFVVIFPELPGREAADVRRNLPLELHVTNTILPGLSFDVTDTSHIYKHQEVSGRIIYDPWTFGFLVDEQLKNYRILFEWFQYVHKNFGIAHSKSEYSVDASLELRTAYGKTAKLFTFRYIYPAALAELTWNYQERAFIEGEATFNYDYMEMVSGPL